MDVHSSTSPLKRSFLPRIGARIALPGFGVAVLGHFLKPYLINIGWLNQDEPFRKIGFIIALGTILGAAILDVSLILYQTYHRFRQRHKQPVQPQPDWERVNMLRLVLWVLFWGAGIVTFGSRVCGTSRRLGVHGSMHVFGFGTRNFCCEINQNL